MTYEVQQTRWDALIRRVSGSIGPGSRVSETISELFPVLEVERTTPELLALSDWRTVWQSTERAASVGERSASQLFNPVGSGTIVAVTQVLLRTDVATNIQLEIQNTQIGGTPVSGLFRDSRFGVPRLSVATVESADNVAVGGGARLRTEADVLLSVRDDNGIVVLTPGTGLAAGTTSDQVVMTVNYFWRERPAQLSELQF